jgi:hypothetical protein
MRRRQMASKATFIKLAASKGITFDLEDSCDMWDITLWAPDGMMFEGAGAACSVTSWFAGTRPKAEFWDEVIEEIGELA